jgi:hypothetical protein
MTALASMPATKDPFAKVGGHLARQRRRRPPSGREGATVDFRGRTKAELGLARGIALRGRARMTKAEPVRALARAR